MIGLTASPGVGAGGSIGAASVFIKQLCYKMDVEHICTVKENNMELVRYVNEPQHSKYLLTFYLNNSFMRQ